MMVRRLISRLFGGNAPLPAQPDRRPDNPLQSTIPNCGG